MSSVSKRNGKGFFSGAVIGALGGLIGLGGAEFRLPVLIGSFKIPTLEAVITQHYARKGRGSRQGHGANPLRSPFIEGFTLSRQEVADLVAFMQSLTDESFVNNPKFANPFLNGRKLTPAEHGRR